MSLALARKWRPKSFEEMVGQIPTITALTNALNQGRLHHAYLFTGTRGVGKTTLARLIGMCLTCELGITSKPCGTCNHCTAVTSGQHIDVIEIDAASRTKVEDTREILDTVHYAPHDARFKLFIIDEVHMLSTHSFNALLKTLEEPPAHVKFLFATTDPQKLPTTVLSRCLQFHLSALSHTELFKHFSHILSTEKITYDDEALHLISQAAQGSVRDGLSLLDQAIALCPAGLTENHISQMLGHVSLVEIKAWLTDILNRDAAAVLQRCANLQSKGADCHELLRQLLTCLHSLICHINVPDLTCPIALGEVTQWAELSTLQQHEWLQLLYQIGIKGSEDLHLAPTIKMGLDIILLRMACLTPSIDPEQRPPWWHQNSSENAAIMPAVKTHQPTSNAKTSQSTSTNPAEKAGTANRIQPDNTHPLTDRNDITNQPLQAETHLAKSLTLNAENWHQIASQLAVTGMTRALIQQTGFKDYDQKILTIIVNQSHQGLVNATQKQRITSALNQMGYSCNVQIEIQAEAVNSIHKNNEDAKVAAYAQAKDAIEKDQKLQALMQTFDGQLGNITTNNASNKTNQ